MMDTDQRTAQRRWKRNFWIDQPCRYLISGNGLGDDELVCYVLPPLDAARNAVGCCWLLLLVVVLLVVVVRGDFGASVFRSKPSHDDKSDAHDLANHRFPLRALAATHQSQVALGELEIFP